MNAKEKIEKMRDLYVKKYGKIPTALIVGETVHSVLKPELGYHMSDMGSYNPEYLGMHILIDVDRTTRVEVCDLKI